MNRPSKLWGWAAGIFTIINLLGAGYAAGMGERAHADLHLVLMLIGAVGYLAWRSMSRGQKPNPAIKQPDSRLDYLQQSVDAVALEVERLGEAQRAKEKLQKEQVQPPSKKDE